MSLVGRQTFITTDKDGRGRRDRERTTASHITPIRIYDISLSHRPQKEPHSDAGASTKSCPRAEEKKSRIIFTQLSQYQVSTCHHPNYTFLKEKKRCLSIDLTDFRACPGLTRDVPSLHRHWI